MGALKSFKSPHYHPTTFPEICNGLLFRSILRMCVQNFKFVALPVPEIIGGTQKIWAVPVRHTLTITFFNDELKIKPNINIKTRSSNQRLTRNVRVPQQCKQGQIQPVSNTSQCLYTPTLHFLPNL